LTSIILYWKPVSNFSDASFLGVPRIQTLVADNCGLSSLSAGAFSPLSALTTLNLGNNALTKLTESGWRGPSKLTTLTLQVNSIAALPKPCENECEKVGCRASLIAWLSCWSTRAG
jgi:hypothetical protein